jgi:hypothetical protein
MSRLGNKHEHISPFPPIVTQFSSPQLTTFSVRGIGRADGVSAAASWKRIVDDPSPIPGPKFPLPFTAIVLHLQLARQVWLFVDQ